MGPPKEGRAAEARASRIEMVEGSMSKSAKGLK